MKHWPWVVWFNEADIVGYRPGVLSQRILCLFWGETYTKGLHARSPKRPEGRGKEGSREDREGHSQQKGAEKTSRENRSVRRWESGREETSQQKSERRLLGPVDQQMSCWPTWEDESVFLVALREFLLEYTIALAHRMHKKCHRLPPLALGANPSPSLFVLFLHPPRLGILCVGIGIWNTPGQRWEKLLDYANGWLR